MPYFDTFLSGVVVSDVLGRQSRGTVTQNRRDSTVSHRRAPYPRIALLMLLLAIELYRMGSTTLTYY